MSRNQYDGQSPAQSAVTAADGCLKLVLTIGLIAAAIYAVSVGSIAGYAVNVKKVEPTYQVIGVPQRTDWINPTPVPYYVAPEPQPHQRRYNHHTGSGQ